MIKKSSNEIKIMADSNISLINGKTKKFYPDTKLVKGEIFIPVSFARYIDKNIFKKYDTPVSRKYATIRRIVIDPGHGGKNLGAVGRKGLKEKDVVLDISKRLKKLLERSGNFEVILTRNTDKFISLAKRSEIANNAKADLFISVHANAARARSAKGFEVYYLSDATDDTARAIAAAENESFVYENGSAAKNASGLDATLWDMKFAEDRKESKQLASIICKTAKSQLKIKNRGVKSAKFYVLKGTRMPAILVEVGFLSNSQEEAALKKTYYREKVAKALASGIIQYEKEFERTDGFTQRVN